LTAVAGAVPWLAGCGGPQSILDPAGPSARLAATLWWGMFALFALVLAVVVTLWLYAVHGRRKIPRRENGRAWIIGGGVLLPLLSVAAILAFGIPAGHRMGVFHERDPLVVEVTGHQWWWQVRYPGAAVETANQLVIPAGRPIHIHAGSGDVIHSFWVPRLGGKIDMIPGRRNVIQIEADRPGVYRGQCAEFCGAQHARMVLVVEALDAEAFEHWLAQRQGRTVPAPDGATLAAFRETCGSCHRVAGLSPGGDGPDLSDVGARATLGAGTLDATLEGSQLQWLQQHQQLKPGNRMPEAELPPDTLAAIAAWLEGLAP
jgi:cytochrome c oxidase subunit 2